MQRVPDGQSRSAARAGLLSEWIKLVNTFVWTRSQQEDVLRVATGKINFRDCTDAEIRKVLREWGRDPDEEAATA